jgi:predicted xylose isomerase-like sugar epimerase
MRVSRSVGAEAVILCPTHLPGDRRSPEQAFRETVQALKAFRPYFEDSGLAG